MSIYAPSASPLDTCLWKSCITFDRLPILAYKATPLGFFATLRMTEEMRSLDRPACSFLILSKEMSGATTSAIFPLKWFDKLTMSGV